MRQKGFIAQLLILLLLGLVLFSLIYFKVLNKPSEIAQNTPVPVASVLKSQIFTGENIQFEVPATMSATLDSEDNFNKRGGTDFRSNFNLYMGYQPEKVLEVVTVLTADQNYDKAPLTVWVFENPNNLTLEQWFSKYWYFPFVWGDFTSKGRGQIAPVNEIKIGTASGQLGKVDYSPGQPQFIYLPRNDKMFLIKLVGNEGQKILESFKLL